MENTNKIWTGGEAWALIWKIQTLQRWDVQVQNKSHTGCNHHKDIEPWGPPPCYKKNYVWIGLSNPEDPDPEDLLKIPSSDHRNDSHKR